MSRSASFALGLFLCALPVVARAQDVDTTIQRRVNGRVVKGTRTAQIPVPDAWVVLHRVGPDRAGPLDSTRTGANGTFTFRYHASGSSEALYFASTTYGGVAYFAPPLRLATVSGDDATITVFDTTSGAVKIKPAGRHIVIGAPQDNGRRPVGEVYDLQNDSTVTVIAHDTTPIWTAHLPPGATNFQLNPNGDVAAGAISRHGSDVGLFTPISPGIRQLAFTYELPIDVFPLSISLERGAGVLEVLVQEPSVHVEAPGVSETSPASTEGRVFRRFLGQDVKPNSVLRISVPRMIGAERQKLYVAVGVLFVGAMMVALLVGTRPSALGTRQIQRRVPSAERRATELARAIATLDAEYEAGARSDDDRATYEANRAALKQQLADALARERQPT